ncbi:HipA domain-containing protein [Acidovorax sp. HDW3]|uniref:HipA domain-containing protein n=1 Tax=Acidovorax sp. HDW3 TaxID=2714923 RepID=UPI00351ABD5E
MAFNNRDDHPKNFSYLMDSKGHWQLAPAYDVTYYEGPAGYHQMDIMGEALNHIQSRIDKNLKSCGICTLCAKGAQGNHFCGHLIPLIAYNLPLSKSSNTGIPSSFIALPLGVAYSR